MTINKTLFFLALSLCIIACQQKENRKELRSEVIKLHDEVMAKNSEVVNLQMTLDTLIRNVDSLKKANPQRDTAVLKKDLIKLLERLKIAEEGMNEWMHAFEPDTEGKTEDEASSYFQAEKKKLQRIDSLYDESREQTKAYLKKSALK
ncbi:hypothetical protein [Arcticibacter tournemirensis]